MLRNSEKQGCQWYGLNLFVRIRGIAHQGFGHLFITSSSSHFFNKTHHEQYLFKHYSLEYKSPHSLLVGRVVTHLSQQREVYLRFKSSADQIGHSDAKGSPPPPHFFERGCVAKCNDSLHASVWVMKNLSRKVTTWWGCCIWVPVSTEVESQTILCGHSITNHKDKINEGQ